MWSCDGCLLNGATFQVAHRECREVVTVLCANKLGAITGDIAKMTRPWPAHYSCADVWGLSLALPTKRTRRFLLLRQGTGETQPALPITRTDVRGSMSRCSCCVEGRVVAGHGVNQWQQNPRQLGIRRYHNYFLFCSPGSPLVIRFWTAPVLSNDPGL